jgi:hypothetical protein
MNERIRQALDGEIGRSALTAGERELLAEAEADIAAVLASVPVAPLPDLGPMVLGRIRAREKRSALGWLWRPRTLVWRPAYGLAAAALFVLALGLGRRSAPDAPVGQQVLTRFALEAPGAREVMLAGDFTEWQATYRLTHSESGVWTVVVPLDPGIHNYAFVIDGQRWVADPNAPAVADGFGGLNSRLAVLGPDRAEL